MKLTSAMGLIALLLPALHSTFAYAIPEHSYLQTFDSDVIPFCQTVGQSGDFIGAGGFRINYRKFEITDERGAVVLSPGLGESYLNHSELAYDLVQAGYSVYIIDHRGQGFSQRLTREPEVVRVEDYDYYLTDFATFVDRVVKATPHRHLYLLANSMGALIGSSYLAIIPGTFERAVLVDPMFDIELSLYEKNAQWYVSTFFDHDADAWIPARKIPGADRELDCRSPRGLEARLCKVAELEKYNPEVKFAATSIHWALETEEAIQKLRKTWTNRIRIPVLLLQADPDVDPEVSIEGQNLFCSRASACKLQFFPGSSRRILHERDSIRDRALSRILDFFSAQ